jgi:DNA-binding response OmpR family regulator
MLERSQCVLKPSLDSLLVIEERPALAASFAEVFARRARVVRSAPTAASACRLLRSLQPDLVLLDVAIPGAFDVLKRMQILDPLPVVVAMRATGRPEESFRLAQLGVRTYLERCLTKDSLESALDWALLRPSNFIPYAA